MIKNGQIRQITTRYYCFGHTILKCVFVCVCIKYGYFFQKAHLIILNEDIMVEGQK